jgi:hypothetical protein
VDEVARARGQGEDQAPPEDLHLSTRLKHGHKKQPTSLARNQILEIYRDIYQGPHVTRRTSNPNRDRCQYSALFSLILLHILALFR